MGSEATAVGGIIFAERAGSTARLKEEGPGKIDEDFPNSPFLLFSSSNIQPCPFLRSQIPHPQLHFLPATFDTFALELHHHLSLRSSQVRLLKCRHRQGSESGPAPQGVQTINRRRVGSR